MEYEADDRSLITQAGRLQTLNEIGRVLSSALDLGTLYDTIYQQIGRVMDASLFFLGLLRTEQGIIELPYMREEGKLYLDEQMPYGNSVTTLVVERGTPLLFNTDEAYRKYVRENGLPDLTLGEKIPESMIFMPLHTGRRTIGALSIQSMRPHAYTEEDVQTLSVIASQAAVAIVNAALYQQSQENVHQMQVLLQVARTVNSSLDLQSVLSAILASMREVAPFHVAVVLLPNHDERVLEIMGAVGRPEYEKRIEGLRDRLKIPFERGAVGAAFGTGEPVIAPDASQFPDYIDQGVDHVQSELAMPLKRGDQVIGVLDIEREGSDAFSHADLNLLSLFASQAAIAIENARLYGEQQHRVNELQTIQSIVQKLTPLHDIPSIAEVIDTELKGLIDHHAARLFVLDATRQLLVPVQFAGAEASDYQLRVGEGVAGWIAQEGTPLIVGSSLHDPRVSPVPGTVRREESIIGAPLIYEGRVQGVITLSALGPRQFDENALRLLKIVAGQAAIAFDRARLYDELRTEAITDPLTKLSNRRYLTERLKEEQARVARTGESLSAIMLDVDTFKGVNDRFGHDAGDAVLQAIAGIIRAVVRAADIVARYGGEEFCVVMPGIPPEEAEHVAERLRSIISRSRLPREARVPHITVSVGVAHRFSDELPQDLFTRADRAMYEAKRLGGDGVIMAGKSGFHPYRNPAHSGEGELGRGRLT